MNKDLFEALVTLSPAIFLALLAIFMIFSLRKQEKGKGNKGKPLSVKEKREIYN